MFVSALGKIWSSMQITALAYTPQEKELTVSQKQDFIKHIHGQLTCMPTFAPQCAIYLASHPLETIQTGADAFHWTIDFHNHVNRTLGKKTYSYEQASEEMNARFLKDRPALLRAEVVQTATNKQIRALQEEIAALQAKPNIVTNDKLFTFIVVTLAVTLAVLLMLIIVLAIAAPAAKKVSELTTLGKMLKVM